LPLFAAAAASEPEQSPEGALALKLRGTDLDALSPREALDLLYDLKRALD
jgi:DNA mismatch repair protein MutS